MRAALRPGAHHYTGLCRWSRKSSVECPQSSEITTDSERCHRSLLQEPGQEGSSSCSGAGAYVESPPLVRAVCAPSVSMAARCILGAFCFFILLMTDHAPLTLYTVLLQSCCAHSCADDGLGFHLLLSELSCCEQPCRFFHGA